LESFAHPDRKGDEKPLIRAGPIKPRALMTLDRAINILAAVTLFEMMMSIGLSVAPADIGHVARNWPLLFRAALANYVLFPLAAVGLLLAFQAPPMVAAGFLIAAVCPGAPYGPPFTGMARGNVALSVGLMVLLAGSSALLAPMLLQLLLPMTSGGAPASIAASELVGTLLTVQFLPLCIGLFIRSHNPRFANRIEKPAARLSLFLNLALLGLILTAQFPMLLDLSLRAYAGMLALIAAGIAAGWLLGGPRPAERRAMVMATAVRNVGVGLVIATSSFSGTPAVMAITAFAIVQTLAMALVAYAWGRRSVSPPPRRFQDLN